jgi:hypothetical protein
MSCRICHEDESDEKLIAPCACSGSIKYAHRKCMLQWVQLSNRRYCEICKTQVAEFTCQISFRKLLQRGNYLVFVWQLFFIKPVILPFIGAFFLFFDRKSIVIFDPRITPIMIWFNYVNTGGLWIAFVLYCSSFLWADSKQPTILKLLDDLE